MDPVTRPTLDNIAPFFIVSDLSTSLDFYCKQLGFSLTFAEPAEEPFFAIFARDGVRIMAKEVLPDVLPLPNHRQHAWAKWDAFIHTSNPDALAAEFMSRGVTMHAPLGDTEDGLRGFELADPNGYVLFFGRPT